MDEHPDTRVFAVRACKGAGFLMTLLSLGPISKQTPCLSVMNHTMNQKWKPPRVPLSQTDGTSCTDLSQVARGSLGNFIPINSAAMHSSFVCHLYPNLVK